MPIHAEGDPSFVVLSAFLAEASKAGQEKPARALANRFFKAASVVDAVERSLAKGELTAALARAARKAIEAVSSPIVLGTLPLDDGMLLAGLVGLLAARGDAAAAAPVGTLLAHATTLATSTTLDMPPGESRVDLRDKLLAVLRCGASGSKLAKHVASLERQIAKRRAAGEAQRLLRRVAPSVAALPEPKVHVWVADGKPPGFAGSGYRKTQVSLRLAPAQSTDWEIDVYGPGARKTAMITTEGVVSDDFDLPILRGIEAFPTWLLRVERKLGVRLDRKLALVQVVGAKPKGVEASMHGWLAGAEEPPRVAAKMLSAEALLRMTAAARRDWFDESADRRRHAGEEATRMRREARFPAALTLWDELIDYHDLAPLNLLEALWTAAADNNGLKLDRKRSERYLRIAWPRMFHHLNIPGNMACLLLELGQRDRIAEILRLLRADDRDDAIEEIRTDPFLAPLLRDRKIAPLLRTP